MAPCLVTAARAAPPSEGAPPAFASRSEDQPVSAPSSEDQPATPTSSEGQPAPAPPPPSPPREVRAPKGGNVGSTTPQETSVEDILRRGRNEYAYGDYPRAVETLRSLLYPMRLYSDEQVIETRRYLGLALYLLDRKNEARQEFLKLLFLDPDYELDPFTVAPPIIDLFEQVRRENRTELDIMRERKVEQKLERELAKGVRRTVTINVYERSEFATFMPFGVGQFVNGDIGWGVTFALVQLACLAVNVGSFIYLRALERTYPPELAEAVRNVTIAQFAGAAAFGVAWSIGVFHARLNFVPTETRRSVSEEHIGRGGGPGAHITLGWDF